MAIYTWRHRGSFCGMLLSLSVFLLSNNAHAATGLVGAEVTTDQVIVILDPQQNPQDIGLRLAQAGFPSISSIPGLPPRYRNWRHVTATNNAETRAQLLAVNGILDVRPVYHASGLDYPILTNGQVIVKFKPGTTLDQANAIAAQEGCRIFRQFAGLPQAYGLVPTQAGTDPGDIAKALAAHAEVAYSHPSTLFKLKKAAIDDPLYVLQWHLKNTGQLAGSKVGADINVEEAWQTTLGNGAIVADIDDNVQKDHEDLKDNYLTGFDFLGSTLCDPFSDPNCSFGNFFSFVGIDAAGGDGDPSPFFGPDPFNFFSGDPDGVVGEAHGTSTAGLICAEANTLGGRGVAPAASLIGIKIGLGFFYTTDQDVADAFLFAGNNGAMVVNNSWGGPGFAILPTIPNTFLLPNVITDAIDEISTNGRGGKGVLVTFAAGNQANPIDFGNIYAARSNVMAVGATMRDDTIACYSNFGPELSVVAPGGGVSSNFLFGFSGCFDSDITTTDVSEVPCFFADDFDNDGFPDPGFPCRGYNPRMRFLNVFFSPGGGFNLPGCNLTSNPGLCVPLVSDTSVTDFPESQANYTHHFNGTSAATPIVSGTAALVFSVNTELTAEQVRNIIEHTADKVGSINETFDVVTGHNDRYGHGRVNAGKAVKAAVASQNWPSPVTNVQEVSSQGLIRIFWDNPANDAAGVLIVRAAGDLLDWHPVDGVAYSNDQTVAPNVIVVSNDLRTQLDQTGLQSGNFQYGIFVRNAANFYAWGRRTGFTSNNPGSSPIASIGASPRFGSVPLTVHFAGGAVDSHPIIAFNWNFGDGTTGSGAALDHTFTKGGTFIVKLTLINSLNVSGSTTETIQVASTPNALPQASMTANPTSGAAPLAVNFVGIASDPDGFIVSYSWDFGDGSTAVGQSVQHIYLASGTFAAVLTVTDNQGGINYAAQTILVTSGVTAAATDPPGILNKRPLCGFGAPAAAAFSMLGLMLMAAARRRF